MLESLKKNKLVFDTVWFFRKMVGITPESLNHDFYKKRTPKLIEDYLQKNQVKKLQIGCQDHPMPDWLNADIEPKSMDTILMDATTTFPLPSDTFDFVFSEHMIEHVSLEGGDKMIQECFRVMKKGGKIRIVTPDLAFLIDLYQKEKSQVQEDYLKFSQKYFTKYARPLWDTMVINNFVRDWGHQFIHDEKSLRYLLEKAGFTNFKREKVYESTEPTFQNLEKHALEITEDFNKLESIIVEAEKP